MPKIFRGSISQSDIESEDVPFHRAYGVKKRVTVFTYLNEILAWVLAVVLFGVLGVMWVLGAYTLFAMMGGVGIALAFIVTALFVYFKLCRKLRKRAKFMRKLKRRCRKLGYKITVYRSFLKGLKLNKSGFDLTVNTGSKLWCIRFFTPPKYLCHLVILSKDRIQLKTNLTKSHFKFILGFNNTKIKELDYSFKDELPNTGKKAERALILNPVPHELFKKDEDGAVIPTGTGSRMYGYTIFTGTGFLETLERESKDSRRGLFGNSGYVEH